MSAGSTTKKVPPKTPDTTHDWSALDAMTEAEKHAAALSDPDAHPITEERWQRMKPVPRAKTLRRALGLSQEEFSATFQNPLGTPRD